MTAGLSSPGAAVLAPLSARWSLRRATLTLAVLGLLGWTLLSIGEVDSVLRTTGAIWSRPDLLVLFLGSYSAAFALRAVAWRLLLAPDGRAFAIGLARRPASELRELTGVRQAGAAVHRDNLVLL